MACRLQAAARNLRAWHRTSGELPPTPPTTPPPHTHSHTPTATHPQPHTQPQIENLRAFWQQRQPSERELAPMSNQLTDQRTANSSRLSWSRPGSVETPSGLPAGRRVLAWESKRLRASPGDFCAGPVLDLWICFFIQIKTRSIGWWCPWKPSPILEVPAGALWTLEDVGRTSAGRFWSAILCHKHSLLLAVCECSNPHANSTELTEGNLQASRVADGARLHLYVCAVRCAPGPVP